MTGNLEEAHGLLVEALGRQSAFWGLGRTAGEMYAVLYLSGRPVSLADLAGRLGVTKGNISIAIRQLEQLGMVRRSWQRGDRRTFFEAEVDLWRIAISVLSLRHKPEFDKSFALVEKSFRLAQQAEPSPEREDTLARLTALKDFYRVLDTVVEMALGMTAEDLKALAQTLSKLRPEP